MSIFTLTLLPANEGDCLWLEYGARDKPRRVLIDGGRKSTYAHLSERLRALPEAEREFELLVVTHIDRDHIEGVVEFMSDREPLVTFRDIWFNGYDHLIAATGSESFGVDQGEKLTAYLKQPEIRWNEAFRGGPVVCPAEPVRLPGGLKLSLVSPSKEKLVPLIHEWVKECQRAGIRPGDGYDIEPPELEAFGTDVSQLAQEAFEIDKTAPNGSSIALVAEYRGKRILLAADAHPDVLAESLKAMSNGNGKVHFDAVKLAHHGSAKNTSRELLELIDCDTWIFSTSGAMFKHPSASAVARVIKYGKPKRLVFNYRSDETKLWDSKVLKTRWKYETVFPSADLPGVVAVSLGS